MSGHFYCITVKRESDGSSGHSANQQILITHHMYIYINYMLLQDVWYSLVFCYVSTIECIACNDRSCLSTIPSLLLWETVAYIRTSIFPLIHMLTYNFFEMSSSRAYHMQWLNEWSIELRHDWVRLPAALDAYVCRQWLFPTVAVCSLSSLRDGADSFVHSMLPLALSRWSMLLPQVLSECVLLGFLFV